MKKNNQRLLFLLFLISYIFTSCVDQKKFVYYQRGSEQSDTMSVATAYISKIQPGDILSVYVNSLSTDASTFFNPYNVQGGASAAPVGDALSSTSAPGFLVDQSGSIELPLIGVLKVAGLTTSETREMIKKSLTTYLKEPTVNVRVLNYKVSITGEVNKPSIYVIPNEKVTLPEALTMAGDLTVTGRRDNILIVRDNNGKKEFGRVDLTSREIYKSPYYYLHTNDLVYVEPVKSKLVQGTFTYRFLPLVVAIASAAVIIFTRLR